MILHFLYITCRKNSLLQGPAIGKGRTAHKKSRAPKERGTDCRKNRKEKRSEKSQCTFAKQSASHPEDAAKRDDGASAGMYRCRVGVLVQTTAPKARPLVQTRPFFIQNNSASPCRADAGAYREPALEAQRARLNTVLGITAAGPAG